MNSFETGLKVVIAALVTLVGGYFSLLMIATNQSPVLDANTLLPYALLVAIGFMWWGLFHKPKTRAKETPAWFSPVLLIVLVGIFAWIYFFKL